MSESTTTYDASGLRAAEPSLVTYTHVIYGLHALSVFIGLTSAATVMGHFPLVLASGPGAGARNSIGIVLVTGMVIGTVFTLFVVPAIYLAVAKRREAVPADAEVSPEPVAA